MNRFNLSSIGKLTAPVFDEYPVYQCSLSSELINNYLPDRLPAFNSKSLRNIAKKLFYSKPTVIAFRSQLNDQSKQVSSSNEIEYFLEDLLLETDQIMRYNFVITGSDLILIKIAHLRHISYHILGKHITLSNRSNDVRFAGELWRDQNGIYRLNNSSGTYLPPNSSIDKTVQVFNQLTPHLQFQGISFQNNSRPSFKHRFISKITDKKVLS